MAHAWIRTVAPVGAILLAGLLLVGCEEAVNPVLGTERAFTLYGFFNARADTQAVRLFAIEGRLELTRSEPLDAEVASMDLQRGQRHVWQDSVVQYSTEQYGHVYWSAFRAEYGRRYRLEATRSDGATTHVEVTVPPLSEPLLLEPTIAPGFVVFPLLWQNAPRVNNMIVRYFTNCGVFDFPYGVELQEQVEASTRVTVRLSDDARQIFQEIYPACTVRGLRMQEVEVVVLVTNAEWISPTGMYDPELLVEPGTFSNVENGFGFVGAGYPASFRWEPSEDALTAAGFFVGDEEE